MKKAKTLTEKQFNALTNKEQAKELKRMAKRSNSRLSLLEESGQQNQVYYEAQDYNLGGGRAKNRFAESVKYKTVDDIKKTYTALSNFLNNKKSTLGGINTESQEKVHALIEKGQFDYNTLNRLSEKEKTYIAKEASKKANKQLKELEKSKIDKFAYQVADHYNKETGRKNNRFYTGGKFKSGKDINTHIQNVFNFLNSETATARGYVEVIKKRLNKFRKNGVAIQDKDEQKFLDFLSSKQFESLKKNVDSKQIISTYVDARNKEEDVNKILQEFEDYLNTDTTWDEVQEKLNVAKYQQGGLLH